MKDLKQKLMIMQMDAKLKEFSPLLKHQLPEGGWIQSIRISLKMSLRQFGERMKVTRQGAENLEKREKEGAITLKSLEEAGRVLNMKFVYGFVPMEGSIENKARALALKIVKTTSDTMALEDQKNTKKRLKKAANRTPYHECRITY